MRTSARCATSIHIACDIASQTPLATFDFVPGSEFTEAWPDRAGAALSCRWQPASSQCQVAGGSQPVASGRQQAAASGQQPVASSGALPRRGAASSVEKRAASTTALSGCGCGWVVVVACVCLHSEGQVCGLALWVCVVHVCVLARCARYTRAGTRADQPPPLPPSPLPPPTHTPCSARSSPSRSPVAASTHGSPHTPNDQTVAETEAQVP